jgi:hypothetical protein
MTGEDGVDTDINAAATFAAASVSLTAGMHLRPWLGHHRLELNQGFRNGGTVR